MPCGRPMIPAGARGLGDARQRDLVAGHADDADRAVAQLEIARRAFQHVGGDGEGLFAQHFAGVVDRGRERSPCCGSRSCRSRSAIAEVSASAMTTSSRLDLPGVGHHLREDRLHALPLRTGAGGDIDLAGRIDAHHGALERPDAGALDVAAEAEAEIAALRARLALALRNASTPPIASSAFCRRLG